MGVRWETTQDIATLMGLTQATVEKHQDWQEKFWCGNHGTGRYSCGVSEPNFPKQVIYPFTAHLLPLYRQKVCFSLLVDI